MSIVATSLLPPEHVLSSVNITRAERVPGFMHAALLYRFAAQVSQCQTVAEVGCWRGRTTRVLCDHCPGIVYAVDSFEGSPGLEYDLEFMRWFTNDRDWLWHEFQHNLEGSKNLRVIPKPSVEAARLVPDESLDWCLIDALHDYHSVCEDLKAWWPKMKRGSLFVGHDFDQPEVRQAIKDCFPGDWQFPDTTGVWEVHKP